MKFNRFSQLTLYLAFLYFIFIIFTTNFSFTLVYGSPCAFHHKFSVSTSNNKYFFQFTFFTIFHLTFLPETPTLFSFIPTLFCAVTRQQQQKMFQERCHPLFAPLSWVPDLKTIKSHNPKPKIQVCSTRTTQ